MVSLNKSKADDYSVEIQSAASQIVRANSAVITSQTCSGLVEASKHATQKQKLYRNQNQFSTW